jgi:eukaryotic-like serine/threonine-protein kinase
MMRVGLESPSSLPGAKPFGKYFLLDRIGVGGMAEVFLAVAIGPQGFQRTLVIKRMLSHLSKDRAFVKMFIDEAKLCGLLSHPNLVQIFEFGQIEESFFIAMEYVQGETLLSVQAKLAEENRIAPVGAALEMVRQVCLGLQYAHGLQATTGQALGIVHRDISPSNLMVNFHGGVKILDFGIARVTEELRETKTQAGTMKGKVSYMSPEQVKLENIDGRSDVFAVGIVLHELLTGRRLFKSSNEFTGAKLILEAVVPLPSSVNPAVPASVDPIVMRALDRNLETRYQTAGEMAEDIEKALFEMRASPHEARKLLISLFPQGPSRTGEVQLPFTPSPVPRAEPSATGSLTPRGSTSKITKPTVPADSPLEVDLGDLAASGPVATGGRRRAQKRWLALGALGGAVIAVVVLVQSPHKGPSPQEVAVSPAAAQSAPIPAAPKAEPPAPPTAKEKARIEISLDSTPQDAQVIREDSGETLGRTPLTITLPLGRDVISFRFEKQGFSPASYKVIPDLAKSVRAELFPAKVEEPKHVAVAAQPKRPGPPPKGHVVAAHETHPAAAPAENPAPVAEGARDCLLSIASFPWADLWIDGKDTGQRTPVVHYPVTCGAHRLALKRRDLHVDRTEQVTVAPGHELKQHYDLGGDDYAE